jgi:acetyl esterase/lipase
VGLARIIPDRGRLFESYITLPGPVSCYSVEYITQPASLGSTHFIASLDLLEKSTPLNQYNIMASHKPPYDPECEVVLNAFPKLPLLTHDAVIELRKGLGALATPEVTYLTDPEIVHEEKTIPGPGGPLALSILRARSSTRGSQPAFVYMHGGGMIVGSKLFGINATFSWIKELDAVVISVGYRLAPEHPDPAPIEDCMYT